MQNKEKEKRNSVRREPEEKKAGEEETREDLQEKFTKISGIKKKYVNETLGELITGILLSGGAIQVIDLIVTGIYKEISGTRLLFASGLWIGIGTALFLAMHMYRSIDRALDLSPEEAEKLMHRTYLIRTAVIVVAAGLIHFLKLGYVTSAFLGMLCLNFGAILQPLTRRIWRKK